MKPNIPTLDAAILEDIIRFHLFNLPAVAFSVPNFDETVAAYLPFPIFKVASLRRFANESKQVSPSTDESIRLLNAYAEGDNVLYTELEDRLMRSARFFSRQKFMETVIAWAFIYFYLKDRRAHRCFTAISFLLPSKTLLSYVNRFKHLLEENAFTSKEEAQEKINGNTNGSLEEFAKRYAIGSGISLSNPPSALLNKNCGISKERINAYSLDVPVGISNKPFVYAFIEVVIHIASVVKHRFGLTSQKAALFVLYTLQHLPFFNLQTIFRNIKTSKLWPALINKDGQTSVAVPLSLS